MKAWIHDSGSWRKQIPVTLTSAFDKQDFELDPVSLQFLRRRIMPTDEEQKE
jgi:hypothetical protein